MSEQLAKTLMELILQKQFEKALPLAEQLLTCDRQGKLFWSACFSIYVEYIHIFHPNGPKMFLDLWQKYKACVKHRRYGDQISTLVMQIVDFLVESHKQPIATYIESSYNVLVSPHIERFNDYLEVFGALLDQILCQPQSKNDDDFKRRLWFTVGNILATDRDNDLMHSNGIALFTHTENISSVKLQKQFWSIIRTKAKVLTENVQNNITALYRLHKIGFCEEFDRQSLLIVMAVLYFIAQCDFSATDILADIQQQRKALLDQTKQIYRIEYDDLFRRKLYKLLRISSEEEQRKKAIKLKKDARIKSEMEKMKFDFRIPLLPEKDLNEQKEQQEKKKKYEQRTVKLTKIIDYSGNNWQIHKC